MFGVRNGRVKVCGLLLDAHDGGHDERGAGEVDAGDGGRGAGDGGGGAGGGGR